MPKFQLIRYGSKNRVLWETYIKYIDPKILTSSEKLVLMMLMSYRSLGDIFVSNETLAKHTSLSIAAIKKILRQLREKKYILRSQHSRSRSSLTEIDEMLILSSIYTSAPREFSEIFGVKNFESLLRKDRHYTDDDLIENKTAEDIPF
jgi:DNA-binding MarR family transcriptional regulator